MFYVCVERDGKYVVLDTDDGICEFYTKSDLVQLVSQGIQVLGVSQGNISVISSDFLKAKAQVSR